jgi:hypothetical protein
MKKKLLPWIIALSALTVSGSAAFYSVSGLGKMFAGAALQVMILAGSLEFAKLVTASLLYQYWKKLNLGLKLYLSIATLILIVITSAGIYGFLSSAYQETSFKVQNQDKNIEILDKNISIIQGEIKNFESQVKQKNDRIIQLTSIRTNLQSTQDVLIEKSKSTNAVRQQIKDVDSEIKRMDSEVSVLNDSISSKNTRISSIEKQKLDVSSDSDLAREVGPLKYIAELTGKDIDSVVNWYIIVLMLVFDPLAIALVIAANFAFEINEPKKEEEMEEKENKKPGKIKSLWNRITLFNKKKETLNKTEGTSVSPNQEVSILFKENPETLNKEEIPAEYDQLVQEEPNNNIEEKESNPESNNNKKEDTYSKDTPTKFDKSQRERFRGNPDSMESRKSFRNNPGDENPINLR